MFKQLTLTNIKSFHSTKIPLSHFTVLLGTNASGKSNIRDTFRFLHGISRGYKLIDIFAGKYEGGDQIWSGIRGGPLEFIRAGEAFGSVFAELTEHDLSYKISLDTTRNACRVRTEEVLQNNERIVPSLIYDSPSIGNANSDQPLLPHWEAWFGEGNRYHNAIASKYVPIVQNYFAHLRFLDLSPHALRESSYTGQNVLGDRGTNLSTTLQDLAETKNRKQDLVEWLRALTPMDVADIKFDRDSRGRVSLALVEHSGRTTSVESASDGTLRFLAYLALTFSTETPTTCFIEEIDNGIHPSRLCLLVELLETQSARRNLQIIATSHSPALLNHLSKETLQNALLVYRTEDSPSSNVCPLKDLPNFLEIAERRSPGSLLNQAGSRTQ